MNYTNKAAVQYYIKRNINEAFDPQLDMYIAAMSEYIDKTVGYPVYRTTPATYCYDGTGAKVLAVTPVHTITAVTVDDVAVTPVQWPYNSDVKTELRMELAYFTKGLANIEVTGIHSLKPSLPDSIAWACMVLVAGIVQQVDDQREGVQSEKIGDYSVTYMNQEHRADVQRAKEIINSYRPIVF